MPRRKTPGPRTVLPPYLLDRLAKQGSAHVRASASATLRIDGDPNAVRAAAQTHARAMHRPRPDTGAPLHRQVHSADASTLLPGRLVRGEGDPPTGDAAADEAYDYLGATDALFRQAYGRNGIDGAGMALVGTVHYGRNYENAFWNGEQMVFGDGDGEIFNRFTIAPDIVAHELTHGVIDHEGGLAYRDQSGALNESISDVFGVLAKQHRLRQSAQQADWLIGAGLFTPAVRAQGLRSMAAPGTAYDDPLLGKDPQPAHMRDFVVTQEDNGGVHINSGIPNRAFHLAAMTMGGYAWETAGRIWYEALLDERLTPRIDFAGYARLTLEHAARAGQPAHHAVQQAWRDVGVEP